MSDRKAALQIALDVASDAEVAVGSARLANKAAEVAADAQLAAEQASLKAARKVSAQTDASATRVQIRGVGDLPTDRAEAIRELSQEQRALRSSRPATRRWRALERLDAEVDRLQARQGDAITRVQEADVTLARAPADDAHALADWLAVGERGQRPPASLFERERDRDAATLLVQAAPVELDRALERRLQHIQANREKMIADANRDVSDARKRLEEQARTLPALRQTLLDNRETLLWISSYPEPVESFGFSTATALGLRDPVEKTLGTKARIEYSALISAIEEDAAAVASAFSPIQKQQLGITEERNPTKQAMWWDPAAGDADLAAWKKQEIERLRNLRFVDDPMALSDEARDLRPNP